MKAKYQLIHQITFLYVFSLNRYFMMKMQLNMVIFVQLYCLMIEA
jgi:hypothetical protein